MRAKRKTALWDYKFKIINSFTDYEVCRQVCDHCWNEKKKKNQLMLGHLVNFLQPVSCVCRAKTRMKCTINVMNKEISRLHFKGLMRIKGKGVWQGSQTTLATIGNSSSVIGICSSPWKTHRGYSCLALPAGGQFLKGNTGSADVLFGCQEMA